MKWNMIYFPWCVWEFIIGEMKKEKEKEEDINNLTIKQFIYYLFYS